MSTDAKFPTLKKNQNFKNMPSYLHVGLLTSFFINLLLIVAICENLPPPLLRFSLRGQFILCGPSYFAPPASPEEENTWRVKSWHLSPPPNPRFPIPLKSTSSLKHTANPPYQSKKRQTCDLLHKEERPLLFTQCKSWTLNMFSVRLFEDLHVQSFQSPNLSG